MRTLESPSLQVAALTHVGLRRPSNQDCIAVGDRIVQASMEEPWVSTQPLNGHCAGLLVADGMGGHPAGEVASRLVVEDIVAALPAMQPLPVQISDLLQRANHTLFEHMARCPSRFGMGTTLAGIVADAQSLLAFNVGDSRVYRIENGSVRQLSIDHSEEAEPGWLLFAASPVRVLTQCLGGIPEEQPLAPHLVELPALAGSEFLICSDGLTDMLEDDAIAECLEGEPAHTVQNLFLAAMRAGGIDNISIVVARVEGTSAADQENSRRNSTAAPTKLSSAVNTKPAG